MELASLQGILDRANDAFFLFDLDSRRLEDVNRPGCRLLGLPRETLIGQKCDGPWAPAALRAIGSLLGGEPPRDGEGSACLLLPVDADEEICVEASVHRSVRGERRVAVVVMRDVSERRRMLRLALYDPLTALPNRVLFEDRLKQTLARAKRSGGKAALLFLDLDRFKEVNDCLGRAGGDRILRIVGERLSGAVRESDTVAHLSGDEFAVILNDIPGDEAATIVARKILALISVPFCLEDGQELQIGASLGLTVYPDDGNDVQALLRNADMAMYEAKNRGRNTYHFYSPAMNRRALARRDLFARLRRGIQEGQFFLEYQPQIDAPTGRVIGAEALLRWRLPDGSLVPPDIFIPAAEETGLIAPLGEWVLGSALAQNKAWQEAGHPPIRMAVNISAHQFGRAGFIETVDRLLQETGLDPSYLEMEVTESVLMKEIDATIEVLKDLKERGIHLAIDDFGTGYSSLSYLKHFPIDHIKIDRSFVRDVAENPDDAIIVQTIIAMGRNLGLQVIAEGVEDERQRDFLLGHDCRRMQGYLFGRPVPADEFVLLLQENRQRSALQEPTVK